MCESDEVDDVWYGVKVKVTRCGAVGEFGGANRALVVNAKER